MASMSENNVGGVLNDTGAGPIISCILIATTIQYLGLPKIAGGLVRSRGWMYLQLWGKIESRGGVVRSWGKISPLADLTCHMAYVISKRGYNIYVILELNRKLKVKITNFCKITNW